MLCVLFALFFAALVGVVLSLAGRRGVQFDSKILQPPWLRKGAALLGEADAHIARNGLILTQAVLLQTLIILLDATTLWILIRSLGARAPVTGVFASFMVATLLRLISIVPAGLGTFEAGCILMLHLTGTSLPVALSATILFRGLSFWLPMIPGVYFSRASDRRPLIPDTEVEGLEH